MLSIADYVQQRGVSQTAVRRQLARYAEELEGHTPRINRKTMLDDFAVEFLDSHRMPREVIIQQASEEVQREINDLRATIDLMKDKIINLQEEVLSAEKEKAFLIEQKAKNELLLEMREQDQEQLQKVREENSALHGQVSEIREELQEKEHENKEKEAEIEGLRGVLAAADAEIKSYKRTWFGFYRKKAQ